MPDIRTKAITQIKTKAEKPNTSSTDVIRNRIPFRPQDQKILPHLKLREPPLVRTKEDIFNGDTEEAIPEVQATEQLRQAASVAAYEATRELARSALETKAPTHPQVQNKTQPPPNTSPPELTPLKIRGEGPAYSIRTKPEAQADIRTAPEVTQTKTFVEEQKAIKAKKQEHVKKRQQQARANARKEHITKTATSKKKDISEMPKKIASAISRTAKAIFNAIAGITGAGAILILLCAVIIAGAIATSPMGILFTDETSEATLTEAIAEINAEYNAEVQSHQTGSYTSILTVGRTPSWRDVVAVFACKTAWSADGADVITLDAKRIDRLSKVFWDMTDISSSMETIEHEDTNLEDEIDDSYTKTILTITISAKTADDMRTEYNFSKQQNEALDLLLVELEELGIFLSDLDISDAGALTLWDRLPENLSNERRMVVQYALSIVGKVNYFWGGKSLVLGWDSRWGTPAIVSATGSPTTGTTRPYGMDCSGFVDWVFYNVSGGSYVIGQGGGCISQHNNCYPISWSEAQPGDLVFYPGDSHIGIVGGWDEYGNIQIIHCASGSLNGVVITGKSGFTSIARPTYLV